MRPPRLIGWASLIAGLALGAAAAMAAPAPTPSGPVPTAIAPAPTTTAPAPPPASGPPVLSGLELSRTVDGQQGHARLLVGVRSSAPATFTIQIVGAAGETLMRTMTTAAVHPAGRAFILLDATTQQGYEV